ncbi:hypothetical protein DSCO28_12290 [Desulfosarcina ovata subsp. sediminis]|uniref:Uncharacterized protein n=1 Tax=Desulfosarcina ovata subsp. sediminis TaxID=885957 RepID=A0A5K7ZR68_9BACT|nr:hypothetical protein [Desulfosarcina ovata]BBO80663.1 hypothetical protein DSCO28_12290 [Desulfosarcina ovata subsp. sediminis]
MKRGLKRKFRKKNFQKTRSYPGEYSFRSDRTKTFWKGVCLGDAFSVNHDVQQRLRAQRMFYTTCHQAQKFAAGIALDGLPHDYRPAIQPQLGPCYTNSPANLAVRAAIGLTAFLEFKHWAGDRLLTVHLKDYLENPAEHDDLWVDAASYKQLAQIVTEKVQTRLLLTDLSRYKDLSAIEIYRLFGASQQDLRFASVPEILEAVILYGDVLPDWKALRLHPVTEILIAKVEAVSAAYLLRLPTAKAHRLVELGRNWVFGICRALAPHLPVPDEQENDAKPSETARLHAEGTGWLPRYRKETEPLDLKGRIPPIDEPRAPTLFAPKSAIQQILAEVASPLRTAASGAAKDDGREPSEEVKKALDIIKQFNETLNLSNGQRQGWEDMRSEIVERSLKNSSFAKGPIEGNPTEGHCVNVPLGIGHDVSGEIFDRPVELSSNDLLYRELVREAEPIAQSLKRILYTNVEQIAQTQRICPSGTLDPMRMAMGLFSEAIFKRYRIVEKPDRRGRPVLLIACDGSGSLNRDQMAMLKTMTCAWLNATAKSRIEVLAGLYHSGQIHKNKYGPLVQWMYHPHKTPAVSRQDAARALVSLPDSGTGSQSDAISLAYMLEEAKKIAKGRVVYLVLMTDCVWNKSLRTEMSGIEEVYTFFQATYQEMEDKLHTTLVALGVEKETGFEDLLDKVIQFSHPELSDYIAAADRITRFVAGCIREQRRHTAPSRVG